MLEKALFEEIEKKRQKILKSLEDGQEITIKSTDKGIKIVSLKVTTIR